MLRTAATVLAFCAVALAEGPTFEVATIKPSAPQEMNRIMMRERGGPGTPDPGQYSAENQPLSRLLMRAFGVHSYQIAGPAWINSERFDVTAKVPPGTTKEQFQTMLQNLLAERFKLKLHKETKESQVYALVVGKGGVKMKEAPKLDPAEAADQPPPGPPQMGKDGRPVMSKGGRGMMMMMGPNGLKMQGARTSLPQLADFLSNQVGRPVFDETGLQGDYEFTLEFSPEGLAMGGMGKMPPPGGGPEGASSESGPTLFTAVQEQLGLKLDPRKGPVDLIVIDGGDRNPVEN
jgi:uncharacterized protein (TIGR03435 family)